MAARRTPTRRRSIRASASQALSRLEVELPETLREFSDRVQARLGKLEREIDRAEVRTRRRLTRVLRDASRTLGRFEAEGERRWRSLTTAARREALDVLHGLERVIEASPTPKRATREASRRRTARP